MTHRLATNYAKNYCNRTPIVKVIVENVPVVTWFFLGHSAESIISDGAARIGSPLRAAKAQDDKA